MKRIYQEVLPLYDTSYYERMHAWSLRDKYRRELEVLFEHLKLRPGEAVLDVGCCTGNVVRYIADKFGCFAVGVDVPSEWVRACQISTGVRGDTTRLPFRDESFDGVLLIHVLGHVPRPEAVLEECYRILRSGGFLGLITPNGPFVNWMKPLNVLGLIRHTPDPTVLRYYTEATLHQTFVATSFHVHHLIPFGALPTLMKFLEPQRLRFLDRFRERLLCVAEKP